MRVIWGALRSMNELNLACWCSSNNYYNENVIYININSNKLKLKNNKFIYV